jgi:hypothetical protein
VAAIGKQCLRISPIDSNEHARGLRVCLTTLLFAVAVWPNPVPAYETDQYSNRDEPIADSTAVLNAQVNDAIEDIVAGWRKGHDEMAFVDAVYNRLGGHYWVDKLESWAMDSPEVDKLDTPRYQSIYSGIPFWDTRFIAVFGIGDTIRVNGQLIGTDKIGHFFSQGRKFYRRYVRYGSEARAAERSAYTERAIFGSMTTGNYSNADLVANYEGNRFYRSLFEDGIIPGKPAILHWEDGHWIIGRPFDWADHVNAYWDEALNVSHFDALLYKPMYERLIGQCPNYWERPGLYTVDGEAQLKARYDFLGLKDASELRLDSLCPVQVFLEKRASAAERSSPDVPGAP